MTIFGKKLSEYVAFQKVVLMVIVVVGLLRLGLSLASVSDSATRWISISVVALAATVWYGVAVHTKGFGSYRHLLPLHVIQGVVSSVIVIVGILISAATGRQNIFTADEYGGTMSVPLHVGGHVVFGMVIGPLVGWAISSLVMLITKKVTGAPKPRPATV
jgi:hypothetical protein